MIFRIFLAWAQSAPAASRAEGASALARAYIESELSDEDRADAEIALTSLLDDPASDVRRAMAVELAASAIAPRHVISALATDQSDVSVPVLSRSPLLADAELADCAVIGDVYAQAAIALRPGLGEAAAWAIADRGEREAAISLAVNVSAALSETCLRRLLERHGEDGEVRDAVLSRSNLPAGVRGELVTTTATALADFVARTGWLSAERACREAREAGFVEIAADSLRSTNLPLELVRHLRQQGRLTPALLLRGLLSGNRNLLTAALCELTGQQPARVAGFAAAWSGAGFGALYTKAGLPAPLLPVFRAALAAQDDYGLIYAGGQRPQLSRLLVGSTIRALEAMTGPDLGKVMALLQRLRAEAARAEARAISGEYVAAALAPPVENPLPAPLEIDLAAIEAQISAAA